MGKKKRKLALLQQAKDAQDRIDFIRKSYDGIQQYVQSQIDEILPATKETPKPQMKKLEELQTLQVNIMKAEEAFNEKFMPEDGEDFDYDVLRDQIGRALDRIREVERTIEVLKGTEQSSD